MNKTIILLIITIIIWISILWGLASAQTLFNSPDFTLYQGENSWVLITPQYDYYAVWLGQDLGAMWIERNSGLSTCIIIRKGTEQDCSLKEFSIMMNRFPRELIKSLKL